MSSEIPLDQFAARRQSMVELQLRMRGLQDERVLRAMAHVPRHEFVADAYRDQAYEDHPLPIEEGQTISQPYIVALSLQALALRPLDSVLEVGTGSGYQTALLAEMVRHVHSIERHETLARRAGGTLRRLGYANVTISTGDGSAGFPSAAAFDAIVVSAAAPSVPTMLFEQLIEGGRMVIPVGTAQGQNLQLVQKCDGRPEVASLGGCAFVPLIGAQDYNPGG